MLDPPPIRILQIDAFADRAFTGNPAAVCLLHSNSTDDSVWMQCVAEQMNLSETAFVRALPAESAEDYELRWFTPLVEVDLCGHATLASAHALWSEQIVDPAKPIRFHTRSGILTCVRNGALIELDFPATRAEQAQPAPALLEALGILEASFVGKSQFDTLVVVSSEDVVRQLKPDFHRLRAFPTRGVMVTSPSNDPQLDFISRFFAPNAGVDEDPVTGSAHCCLGPYWASQLGKTKLTGYQASRRGGIVRVRINDDRVILGGTAVTVLRGELEPNE